MPRQLSTVQAGSGKSVDVDVGEDLLLREDPRVRLRVLGDDVELRLGPESYLRIFHPAPSHVCPFSRPVGVNRGVKSPADPRKAFIYGPEPSRKPDSALSRHPSPV